MVGRRAVFSVVALTQLACADSPLQRLKCEPWPLSKPGCQRANKRSAASQGADTSAPRLSCASVATCAEMCRKSCRFLFDAIKWSAAGKLILAVKSIALPLRRFHCAQSSDS